MRIQDYGHFSIRLRRPIAIILGQEPAKLSGPAMNALRLYPALAFGAAAAIVGYALLSRRNKKSAEEVERERRTQLTLAGRIIDGNVIDVLELEDSESGRQMTSPGLQVRCRRRDLRGIAGCDPSASVY